MEFSVVVQFEFLQTLRVTPAMEAGLTDHCVDFRGIDRTLLEFA
jgi:hypothetical protein